MIWVWFDELLFVSIILGFGLGVVLRYVREDSQRKLLEGIGWFVQAVITVWAVFTFFILGFVYLIAAVLTFIVVSLAIEPVVNRLKLATQKTETADAVTPRSARRVLPIGVDERKVIRILEQNFGLGFEPIHARVIWAISMNRTSDKEIATFLNISQDEVGDAIKFMRKKGMKMF